MLSWLPAAPLLLLLPCGMPSRLLRVGSRQEYLGQQGRAAGLRWRRSSKQREAAAAAAAAAAGVDEWLDALMAHTDAVGWGPVA